MNDSQDKSHLRTDAGPRIGNDVQTRSLETGARLMSAKPDQITEAFKVPIEMLRDFVPGPERIRFEKELAALIETSGQRFLEEIWLSVPAIWGGIVIALFDFCSKWLQIRPLITHDLLTKHEQVVQGFFDFFEGMGNRIAEDPTEVSARLSLRRVYWRQQALAAFQTQHDEDRRRDAVPPRPSPGEVIAAFLARHGMSEKSLLGRVEGKFSKNTLAKIKKGERVRDDRYTALAVAMDEVEPGFERASLLPQ